MRKIAFLSAVLCLALSAPAHSAAPSTEVDPPIAPELIQKWAREALHKPMIWQAGLDYDFTPINLKSDPRPTTEKGFDCAIDSLNEKLQASGKEPLTVCVFTNLALVRRASQEACGESLPATPLQARAQ